MSAPEQQPTVSLPPSALPPGVRQPSIRITPVLDEQRQRWRDGKRPMAEYFVRLYPELAADREGLLDLLYSEVLLREECGESPSIEEYVRRFPQYAEAVTRLLALHHALGQSPSVLDQTTVGSLPPAEGSGGRSAPDTWPTVPERTKPLPVVPNYEILGELGRGGMGVVYKARHLKLKRLVALKMILAGSHAGPDQLERFRVEAEAVARLTHPGIVQIYEVGDHDGLPYCALEFVDGGSLGQRIRSGSRPGPSESAALVEQLARAMQYAHQRQVLHRDLKPANILLTAEGAPKVTDFGLAKQLDTDMHQTHTGQVMGTPSHMAPEQAEGRVDRMGPHTDVYSLGAILYELITGKPPFSGSNLFETLEKVRHDEPMAPRRLEPRCPSDLETIALKCLRKVPAERYASALALAQDLERFQAGEPILARREGVARRVLRRARRHRTAIVTSLVLVAALVAVLVAGLGVLHSTRTATVQHSLETALDETDWTPEQLDRVERLVDELRPLAPDRAEGFRARMLELTRRYLLGVLERPRLQPDDVRGFEATLTALAARDPEAEADLRNRLGRRLRTWETALDLRAPFASAAEAFPASEVVAQNGRLLPALAAGNGPPTLRRMPTTVRSAGNVEVAATFDAGWEKATEVAILLDAGMARQVMCAIAFSPDSKTVAAIGNNGDVRIWGAVSGVEQQGIHTGAQWSRALALGSHNRLFARTPDHRVAYWDMTSGERRRETPPLPRAVVSLALRGETLLAVGCDDGEVRLFDPETLEPRGELKGHERTVCRVVFSPDGTTLATASLDGSVRLWDVARLAAGTVVLREEKPSWDLAFSPDGRTLAVGRENELVLLDVSGKVKSRWSASVPDQHPALAFRADGRVLFDPNRGWDLASQDETLPLDPGQGLCVGISPDGRWLATGRRDGGVVLRDATTLEGGRLDSDGFAFVLATPPSDTPERRTTFEQLRQLGGRAHLRMLRDGVVRREDTVRVPTDTLTLRAVREGDRFTLQVNQQPPLRFVEPFHYSSAHGVVGLHWPSTAGLTALRISRQPVQLVLSPLERGDELFAARRMPEALTAYREFLLSAEGETAQEARYKCGLCLSQMRRIDEAVVLLEQVTGESGERWPLLAGCRLWLERLRQKRDTEADAVFEALNARHRVGDVVAVLAADERELILAEYEKGTLVVNHALAGPAYAAHVERSIAVAEFLGVHAERRDLMEALRLRALQLAGQPERARTAAEAFLRREDAQRLGFDLGSTFINYCWLLRGLGEAPKALAETDRVLAAHPNLEETAPKMSFYLLLDRTRTLAALDRWDDARKQLDDVKALLVRHADIPQSEYFAYSVVHLADGFLLNRQGDAAAARAAWKRATVRAWRAGGGGERDAETNQTRDGHVAMMHDVMASALAGELTDAEAEGWLARAVEMIGAEGLGQQLVSLAKIPPAALRDAWHTERGRRQAEEIVFRTRLYDQVLRGPMVLLGWELSRRDAFGGKMTAEQDALMWETWQGVFQLYVTGKVGKTQAIQLGLSWKGTTGFLGWGSVGPKLPQADRARIAYLLGHRFRTLGKTKEAETFFRTARNDAAESSVVRKLAEAELSPSP